MTNKLKMCVSMDVMEIVCINTNCNTGFIYLIWLDGW